MQLVSHANAEVLELLVEIMSPSKDWWLELSTEQKALIQEGREDVEHGRVISHDEMKQRHGL